MSRHVMMKDFYQDKQVFFTYGVDWINTIRPRNGLFYHPAGIALIVVSDEYVATRIYFWHNGFRHVRHWKRTFKDRTLSRLAREFIEEVVGETA